MNFDTKQIARKRVQILFQQTKQIYKINPKLAQRYLLAAQKIAMATRMRIPYIYKSRICKKCNMFIMPGESSRVRIKAKREPHIIVTCLKCGSKTRIPLKKKIKERKELEQNNN